MSTTLELESAARNLHLPILEENPFPDSVTDRSEVALARFSGWADELRAGLESDVARLKNTDGEPEAYELAALERSLRQWRALEAIRESPHATVVPRATLWAQDQNRPNHPLRPGG